MGDEIYHFNVSVNARLSAENMLVEVVSDAGTSTIELNEEEDCYYYFGDSAAMEDCDKGAFRGVVRIGDAYAAFEPSGTGDDGSKVPHMLTRIKRDMLGGLGFNGHFVGDPWTYKERKKSKNKRGEIVCNGPHCEYYKVSRGLSK
jgi:hypothetical protein